MVQPRHDGLDHVQGLTTTHGEDAVGTNIHAESQRHDTAAGILGSGQLDTQLASLAATAVGHEQLFQQIRHARRISIFQQEVLDVGHKAGGLVEPGDQLRHHLHAAGRGGDDEAVGPRIGVDSNIGKNSRDDLRLLAAGLGHQLDHGAADVTQLLCRLGASGSAAAEPDVAGSLGQPRRIDHALDRQVHRVGQFFSYRVLELEDLQLVDRLGTVTIDATDKLGHFHQVPRTCLNNNRVGSHIGVHGDPRGQPGTFLPFLVQVFEHRGHLRRRSVLQVKDLELGRRIDGSIQVLGKKDDTLQVGFGRQHQQGVGLDQWNDCHRRGALA